MLKRVMVSWVVKPCSFGRYYCFQLQESFYPDGKGKALLNFRQLMFRLRGLTFVKTPTFIDPAIKN
jgi:hypothetical protein